MDPIITKVYKDSENKKYKIKFIQEESNLLLNITQIKENSTDNLTFEGSFTLERLKEKNINFTLLQNLDEAIQFLIKIIDSNKLSISINSSSLLMKTIWKFQSLLKEEEFDILLNFKVLQTKNEITKSIIDLKSSSLSEINNLKAENALMKNEISAMKDKIKNLENELTQLKNNLTNNNNNKYNKQSNYIDLSRAIEIHKFSDNNDSIRWSVLLKDGRLATASKDKSINIYDIALNRKDFSYKDAHSEPIFCINQLSNGNIVTGDSKGNLKIWSIGNNSLSLKHQKMGAHEDEIFCIEEMSNNRFATGSGDFSINIYKIGTWEILACLKKHYDAIRALCMLKNGKFVSGSRENDQSLWFWNVENYKEINKVDNVYCNAFNMYENNDQILVGGNDSVYIVDTMRYFVVRKITKGIFNSIYSITPVGEDTCLLSNYSGYIILFDFKECVVVTSRQFHGDYIYNVVIDKKLCKIVTVSEDSTVKIIKYYN